MLRVVELLLGSEKRGRDGKGRDSRGREGGREA